MAGASTTNAMETERLSSINQILVNEVKDQNKEWYFAASDEDYNEPDLGARSLRLNNDIMVETQFDQLTSFNQEQFYRTTDQYQMNIAKIAPALHGVPPLPLQGVGPFQGAHYNYAPNRIMPLFPPGLY